MTTCLVTSLLPPPFAPSSRVSDGVRIKLNGMLKTKLFPKEGGKFDKRTHFTVTQFCFGLAPTPIILSFLISFVSLTVILFGFFLFFH